MMKITDIYISKLGEHALLMGEGREEIQCRHAEEAETVLRESRDAELKPGDQRLGRIQRTGEFLLIPSSNVNGTELGAQ